MRPYFSRPGQIGRLLMQHTNIGQWPPSWASFATSVASRNTSYSNDQRQTNSGPRLALAISVGTSLALVGAGIYVYNADDDDWLRSMVNQYLREPSGSIQQVPTSKQLDVPSKQKAQSVTVVAAKNDSDSVMLPPPPLDVPSETRQSAKDIHHDVVANTNDSNAIIDSVESPVETATSVANVASQADDGSAKASNKADNYIYIIEPERITTSNEYETKLHGHLRRQAEAHADHLADVTRHQEEAFGRKLRLKDAEVDDKLLSFYSLFLNELVGEVAGLSEALRGRKVNDGISKSAHELWLTVSALYTRVSSTWSSDQRLSISSEIMAVKIAIERHKAANVHRLGLDRSASDVNADADLLTSLTEAIPDQIAKSGSVSSEYGLRLRFRELEHILRKVALVEDVSTATPWRYIVSFVSSTFLSVRRSTRTLPSALDPVDIDKLNAYDLIWLANGHVERGEIDQAVRYLNLLQGEPARVVSSWLEDAVALLELRQLAKALLTYASCCSTETLPA